IKPAFVPRVRQVLVIIQRAEAAQFPVRRHGDVGPETSARAARAKKSPRHPIVLAVAGEVKTLSFLRGTRTPRPNTKHQNPNTKETPSSKSQIARRVFGVRMLKFFW